MVNPPHPLPATVIVLPGLFVAWRLFRRMRRMVGRQPDRPVRARLTVVFFPLLAVMLPLLLQVRHPVAAGAELLGLGVGTALADPSSAAFVRSPLTLPIVGTLAGGCTGHALGSMRQRSAVQPS